MDLTLGSCCGQLTSPRLMNQGLFRPSCSRIRLGHFDGSIFSQHRRGRVAGDQVDEQKNNDGHAQQRGQHRDQAANGVADQRYILQTSEVSGEPEVRITAGLRLGVRPSKADVQRGLTPGAFNTHQTSEV